jgi:hypothetical protein
MASPSSCWGGKPRILELRALHEAMDRAVLDAYNWTDIAVPPFCPKTADEQRALEQFQDTVIDRLFVLNAERAEEEKRLAAANPKKKGRSPRAPATGTARPRRGKKTPKSESSKDQEEE